MTTFAQEFASDMRKRDLARALWTSKWPYHCSWCEGFGTVQGEDLLTQPCQCIFKGQCPRCGAAKAILLIHSHHPVVISDCTVCGWSQKEGGLPT